MGFSRQTIRIPDKQSDLLFLTNRPISFIINRLFLEHYNILKRMAMINEDDLNTIKAFLQPIEKNLIEDWNLTYQLPQSDDRALNYLSDIFNRLTRVLEQKIEAIILSSVNLEQVAPELRSITKVFELGAQEQTDQARKIQSRIDDILLQIQQIDENISKTALLSSEISESVVTSQANSESASRQIAMSSKQVESLSSIVKTLKEHSSNISQILDIIYEISDQTKILSINASIEAVTVGEKGKGFAVIAKEIQKLSNKTKEATSDVAGILKNIEKNILSSAVAVEKVKNNIYTAKKSAEDANRSLENVHSHQLDLNRLMSMTVNAGQDQNRFAVEITDSVSGIVNTVIDQSTHSTLIHDQAELVNEKLDQLLVQIGDFHLSIHNKSKDIVENLALMPQIQGMQRNTIEAFLKQYIRTTSFFELFYITNEKGIQVIDNISRDLIKTTYGSTGYGEDWSQREWFHEAIRRKTTYISKIYRSAATNQFCITISTPIVKGSGDIVGILGADINFLNIMSAR